jgi:hypothetical protein
MWACEMLSDWWINRSEGMNSESPHELEEGSWGRGLKRLWSEVGGEEGQWWGGGVVSGGVWGMHSGVWCGVVWCGGGAVGWWSGARVLRWRGAAVLWWGGGGLFDGVGYLAERRCMRGWSGEVLGRW